MRIKLRDEDSSEEQVIDIDEFIPKDPEKEDKASKSKRESSKSEEEKKSDGNALSEAGFTDEEIDALKQLIKAAPSILAMLPKDNEDDEEEEKDEEDEDEDEKGEDEKSEDDEDKDDDDDDDDDDDEDEDDFSFLNPSKDEKKSSEKDEGEKDDELTTDEEPETLQFESSLDGNDELGNADDNEVPDIPFSPITGSESLNTNYGIAYDSRSSRPRDSYSSIGSIRLRSTKDSIPQKSADEIWQEAYDKALHGSK